MTNKKCNKSTMTPVSPEIIAKMPPAGSKTFLEATVFDIFWARLKYFFKTGR